VPIGEVFKLFHPIAPLCVDNILAIIMKKLRQYEYNMDDNTSDFSTRNNT